MGITLKEDVMLSTRCIPNQELPAYSFPTTNPRRLKRKKNDTVPCDPLVRYDKDERETILYS